MNTNPFLPGPKKEGFKTSDEFLGSVGLCIFTI